MEVLWESELRYFDHTVEYPGVDLFDGMEWGIFYHYVNNWFVQGALCLVGQRVRAWLLERYEAFDPDRLAEVERKTTENPHRWIEWDEFEDDIIVLARGDKPGEWWLFWFDRDVSDCSLGRFRTEDDADTISANIDRWINGRTDHGQAGVVRTDDSGCGWETLTAWRRLPDAWAQRLTFGG